MAVMMVVVLVGTMVVLCRREKVINENDQGLVWKENGREERMAGLLLPEGCIVGWALG